jgi:hypothetical protein
MKKFLQAVVFTGLLNLSSIAIVRQSPQAAAGPAGSSPAGLDNGAIMYLELSKTLDAKKAKAGDPVTAQLLVDVVAHGKIVARRDSKLIGHVTEAQPYTKENLESRLGFVFDKVILKGGPEVPVRSMLLAIRPAPRLTIDAPSAPAPPGMNPASNPVPEKHYPSPKVASPKMNTSSGGQLKARDQEMSGIGLTDIEGLSLTAAENGRAQAIVSFKHNVKLESGVRLDVRVADVPSKKQPAQVP